MIIMGASNQLMPVIVSDKLYSEHLPLVSFVLMTTGTCLLVHSFWSFHPGGVAYTGALCVLSALIIHSINIFLTSKASATTNVVVKFIFTAHIWLILTALMGSILLLNLRFGFLATANIHYLRLHASIGMIGWLLLLVTGVSSRLLPMFLLSRREEKKYLDIAWYLINTGLLLFFIEGTVLHTSNGYLLYAALIVSGILCYLAYVRICFTSAIRKKMDSGMKQSLIAICLLFIPFILLTISILYSHNASTATITGYGYSFLFGFISVLIMGQTFKTLPFIVWMHITKDGQRLSLQPKDLYKEPLVRLQAILYLPGFLCFLSGLLLQKTILMYLGNSFMVIASLLYAGHVFYVLKQINSK
jgi:hypothetical protein